MERELLQVLQTDGLDWYSPYQDIALSLAEWAAEERGLSEDEAWEFGTAMADRYAE